MFKLQVTPATVTKLSFFQIFFLFFLSTYGQDRSPVKFGKISPEDFKKVYAIDNSASAVIIADIGSSEITGNLKGWFSIQFRHFKRVHILNKNGYDVANVDIPLYFEGENEEEVRNLKAHTYNLENGRIVESKLDIRNSVYRTKLSKNHVVKRFTFPAVKEGSIIEYEYIVNSDFIFNLQPWEFQGDHPCLWSEYEVSIPEFFYYVFLQKGNINKTQRTRQETFKVTDIRGTGPSRPEPFIAGVTVHHMIMKNIPVLKEEVYTSTLKNHKARVEFQLKEIRQPLPEQTYMGSWEDFCTELLEDENFGGQLSKDNGWMNDELKIALGHAKDEEQKARSIFRYIQNNFTCTNYSKLYIDQPLKNILKNKKGSEAEINLLLIAMLRKAGLDADPLMLSTRSHGYTYSAYPLIDRFDYVICRTILNNKTFYLDASRPDLGFGRLHWECYNGHARVINQEAESVEFSSDSLTETKITSLMLSSNVKGEIVGNVQQTPGYYESYSIRNRARVIGLKEYVKEAEKDFASDMEIKNYRIDFLENPEEQIQISYDIKVNVEKKDIIYLNPMVNEGFTENPFVSAQRIYPVEMPYTIDEILVVRMDTPQGYEVEGLPKSTRVNFSESGDSFFEYIVENNRGVISIRSRVKITRSYFLPEEHKVLHDFFNVVVAKHNERIVFKKVKKV